MLKPTLPHYVSTSPLQNVRSPYVFIPPIVQAIRSLLIPYHHRPTSFTVDYRCVGCRQSTKVCAVCALSGSIATTRSYGARWIPQPIVLQTMLRRVHTFIPRPLPRCHSSRWPTGVTLTTPSHRWVFRGPELRLTQDLLRVLQHCSVASV